MTEPTARVALEAAEERLDAVRKALAYDGYFDEEELRTDDLAVLLAERLNNYRKQVEELRMDAERAEIANQEPAFAVMPDYTGLHQASFSHAAQASRRMGGARMSGDLDGLRISGKHSAQAEAHGCRFYMNLDISGMRVNDAGKLMKMIGKTAPKTAHFHEDTGLGVVYTGGKPDGRV